MPHTKIINTISAFRQSGRTVSYKVPKWQINVTYMTDREGTNHGYRKQRLLQIERLPMIADTEQYLANCLALLLDRPAIWRPLTTSLCTCPRLPKIKTKSLHL